MLPVSNKDAGSTGCTMIAITEWKSTDEWGGEVPELEYNPFLFLSPPALQHCQMVKDPRSKPSCGTYNKHHNVYPPAARGEGQHNTSSHLHKSMEHINKAAAECVSWKHKPSGLWHCKQLGWWVILWPVMIQWGYKLYFCIHRGLYHC